MFCHIEFGEQDLVEVLEVNIKAHLVRSLALLFQSEIEANLELIKALSRNLLLLHVLLTRRRKCVEVVGKNVSIGRQRHEEDERAEDEPLEESDPILVYVIIFV